MTHTAVRTNLNSRSVRRTVVLLALCDSPIGPVRSIVPVRLSPQPYVRRVVRASPIEQLTSRDLTRRKWLTPLAVFCTSIRYVDFTATESFEMREMSVQK